MFYAMNESYWDYLCICVWAVNFHRQHFHNKSLKIKKSRNVCGTEKENKKG